MIRIFLLIFVVFAVISCSDEKNSAIEKTKQKICVLLNENPSPDGIKKAKAIWENDFVKKFNLNNNEKSAYLLKLRKCFTTKSFKKEIAPLDKPLSGTVAGFLKLRNDNLTILLKNPESPAFSINCTFSGIKKYTDSADFDIEGTLTIYNNNGKKLETYNIYPVPDFYLTMKQGSGNFKFTVYLDAIWYPYGKKPFDKAAGILTLITKAKYYKFELGIKDENKEKNDEKMNDDEILDNLQILSTPAE
jgi:hypothetical protein